MVIIELLETYKHTERRTWQTGERPVVARSLAVKLMIEGKAKYIAEGCGCANQAETL